MSPEASWLVYVVAAAASLSLGVWGLVRYARTRRIQYVVVGALLTAGLGLLLYYLLCLAPGSLERIFDRMGTMVYGPPWGETVP